MKEMHSTRYGAAGTVELTVSMLSLGMLPSQHISVFTNLETP